MNKSDPIDSTEFAEGDHAISILPKPDHFGKIMAEIHKLRTLIDEQMADSRPKSMALTKLDELRLWVKETPMRHITPQ